MKKIMNSPRSKMTIAGFVFLVCSFLQKGISVITTPIFTRLLSTSEYGVYSSYIAWTSIISIFVTLKISSGVLQQAIVKFNEDKGRIISSVQGLSTLLCIFFLLIYILFHDFFNNLFNLSTPIMISMIVSIWLSDAFEIWAQGERNEYNYKNLAIVTVLIAVFKPVLGIVGILLFPSMKVEARIFSLVIVEFFCYFILFFKNIKGGKLFEAKYWKYALIFCLPLVPHYLSQQVLSQTDRIMIRYLCGDSEAGIYSLAYQISMVFTLFNASISSVLNPWIYKRIKNKVFNSFNEIISFLYRILILLNLLLILFSPEIVSIFAPDTYSDALLAIPAVTMSCVFMFLYGVFVCFEFYYEKKWNIVIASVIGAVLNIILNLVFIPKFGFVAASYTTLICYIIFCFLHFIFMKKVCISNDLGKNVIDSKKLLIDVVIFLVLGFSITLIYDYLLIRIILLLISFIILFIYRKKIIFYFKSVTNNK